MKVFGGVLCFLLLVSFLSLANETGKDKWVGEYTQSNDELKRSVGPVGERWVISKVKDGYRFSSPDRKHYSTFLFKVVGPKQLKDSEGILGTLTKDLEQNRLVVSFCYEVMYLVPSRGKQ